MILHTRTKILTDYNIDFKYIDKSVNLWRNNYITFKDEFIFSQIEHSYILWLSMGTPTFVEILKHINM